MIGHNFFGPLKEYAKQDIELFEELNDFDDNDKVNKSLIFDDKDDITCGCLNGLKTLYSYMKLSDECFDNFTEKSMALTITLFKFIKVMDEFTTALEMFIVSSNKIKSLIYY